MTASEQPVTGALHTAVASVLSDPRQRWEREIRTGVSKDACGHDLGTDGGLLVGHDLAAEFPEETRRLDEAFHRLHGPREDRVMPENLRVDPEGGEDRG